MQRWQGCARFLAVGDAVGIDGAYHEHEGRNFVSLEAKLTEIFATHDGGLLDNIVRAKFSFKRRDLAFCQWWIVVHRGSHFGFAGFHYRGAIFGDTASQGDAFGTALERSEDVLPHFFIVGADGELQMHIVGNDVALCAAVNRADSYYSRIEGRILATDDGLDCEDEFGGEHNGIFADLWARAVCATSANDYFDGSGAGEGVARRVGDFPDLEFGAVVQCQSVVGLGNARIQTIGEHGARPVDGFFGGLPDQHQRAVPLIFHRREQFRVAN